MPLFDYKTCILKVEDQKKRFRVENIWTKEGWSDGRVEKAA
jgi:hypothetical protein